MAGRLTPCSLWDMCEGPRAPYLPPHIHTGPVVLAFRANNHRSTSFTWPQWGWSCRARRGSVSERPQPQNGHLKTFQYPGSFRKATVIPMGPHRTFRAMTTKLKIPMVKGPARRWTGPQPRLRTTRRTTTMMRGSRLLTTGMRIRGVKLLQRFP